MSLNYGTKRALLRPATSGTGPPPVGTSGQAIGLLLALTKAS